MKPRWLLDHNVPAQLVEWLARKGILAETAFGKNWHGLSDPDLLSRAVGKFQVLITRAKGFAESSGFAESGEGIAVVILGLPQALSAAFVAAFEQAWAAGAVQPRAGAVIRWP